MQKMQSVVLAGMMILAGIGITGCGGGGDSGGSPAKDLNATGFWEGAVNGATAAGNLTQNSGNVTGLMLLPPAGSANIVGTVNGYHMDFTAAYDSGTSESGSGDFAFVNTGVDKLIFTGTLPSVGSFVISWRGPSFEEHSKGPDTLTYTPPAPTW